MSKNLNILVASFNQLDPYIFILGSIVQCDQRWRFLKVPNDIKDFLGYFDLIKFQVKNTVTTFGNFCLLFISAPGHTGIATIICLFWYIVSRFSLRLNVNIFNVKFDVTIVRSTRRDVTRRDDGLARFCHRK